MFELPAILACCALAPPLAVAEDATTRFVERVERYPGQRDDVRAAWGRHHFDIKHAHVSSERVKDWLTPMGPPLMGLLRSGYGDVKCRRDNVLSRLDAALRRGEIDAVEGFYHAMAEIFRADQSWVEDEREAHIRHALINETHRADWPAGANIDLITIITEFDPEWRRRIANRSFVDWIDRYSAELSALLLDRHRSLIEINCKDRSAIQTNDVATQVALLMRRYEASAKIRDLNLRTSSALCALMAPDIGELLRERFDAALSPFAYRLPYDDYLQKLRGVDAALANAVEIDAIAKRSIAARRAEKAYNDWWSVGGLYERFTNTVRQEVGQSVDAEYLESEEAYRDGLAELAAVDDRIRTRLMREIPAQQERGVDSTLVDPFIVNIAGHTLSLPPVGEFIKIFDKFEVGDDVRVVVLSLRDDAVVRKNNYLKLLAQRTGAETALDNETVRVRYLENLASESISAYTFCDELVRQFVRNVTNFVDADAGGAMAGLVESHIRESGIDLVRTTVHFDAKELCYNLLELRYENDGIDTSVATRYSDELDRALEQFRRERMYHLLLHRGLHAQAADGALSTAGERRMKRHRAVAKELSAQVIELRFIYVPQFIASIDDTDRQATFQNHVDRSEFAWLFKETPFDLLIEALMRDGVSISDNAPTANMITARYEKDRAGVRRELMKLCRDYIRIRDEQRKEQDHAKIRALNAARIQLDESAWHDLSAVVRRGVDRQDVALDVWCLLEAGAVRE